MRHTSVMIQNRLSLIINIYKASCCLFSKRNVTIKYKNREPFLSDGLTLSIKYEHNYTRIALELKVHVYRNKVIVCKSRIRHLLHKAEDKCYSDVLNISDRKMMKLWSNMKGIKNKQAKFRYTYICMRGLKMCILPGGALQLTNIF